MLQTRPLGIGLNKRGSTWEAEERDGGDAHSLALVCLLFIALSSVLLVMTASADVLPVPLSLRSLSFSSSSP